jgi:hypothetical protein
MCNHRFLACAWGGLARTDDIGGRWSGQAQVDNTTRHFPNQLDR